MILMAKVAFKPVLGGNLGGTVLLLDHALRVMINFNGDHKETLGIMRQKRMQQYEVTYHGSLSYGATTNY